MSACWIRSRLPMDLVYSQGDSNLDRFLLMVWEDLFEQVMRKITSTLGPVTTQNIRQEQKYEYHLDTREIEFILCVHVDEEASIPQSPPVPYRRSNLETSLVTTQRCAYCSVKISGDARYCSQCGAPT